jgi:hypothetical protein
MSNSTIKERVLYVITGEDIIACAEELGISEEMITEEVLTQVEKSIELGFGHWHEVITTALHEALKNCQEEV